MTYTTQELLTLHACWFTTIFVAFTIASIISSRLLALGLLASAGAAVIVSIFFGLLIIAVVATITNRFI